MKEIKAIVSAHEQIKESGLSAALATLVRLEGSSYRRMGARMLVKEDGHYVGGISGGCLEGDALRRAQKAIIQKRAGIITYDTTRTDGHELGIGLGCNGIIDVLFSPLIPDDIFNPVNVLSGIVTTRTPAVIVTITSNRNRQDLLGKSLLYQNENQFLEQFFIPGLASSVLKDIHRCLQEKSSINKHYGADEETRVFIEFIAPQLHLVIYGGHHDVISMVKVADELGWKTTVVMNLLKADKSLFASAGKILDRNDPRQPVHDEYCAAILMSHDYKTDQENLERLIDSQAFYIGVLGPRSRTEKMYTAFDSASIHLSKKQREKIFSPAGLDIGATTPEEIALSIAAEIKTCASGRKGMPL
ncbi:MAG: XdhC family protein, partial [Chitinophagaceae bacterium]